MALSSDRPGQTRSGLLSRVWQAVAGAPPAEPPPPPLFKPRPVPPPPPRGPGLPEWDEILLEAPPPPDPRLLPPPDPAAAPGPVPATQAAPTVAGTAGAAWSGWSDAIRLAVARVRALIWARDVQAARAVLEAELQARPDVVDPTGLPVYLLEAYRCAVAANDAAAATVLGADLRPRLAEDDPLLETLVARGAITAGVPNLARAAWMSALHRRPGHAEASRWLALHPLTPDPGTPVADLIAAPAALLDPPPIPLASAALPEGLPPGTPGEWRRDLAIRVVDGAPVPDLPWDGGRDVPGASEIDVAAVLRDPDDLARPAWFGETCLTLFALLRTGPAPLKLARLYVGRQPWAIRASAGPQAQLLATLFPGLRVSAAYYGGLRERAAIVLDGAAGDAGTATLIGGILPLARRHVPEARARVFAACGLPGNEVPRRAPGRVRQALFLRATAAGSFAEPAREKLFALLRQQGFEVATVDLEQLSWPEQVCRIAGADLLFGVHDRVLAHTVWAHPQARVLELFPPGVRRYDTQVLAEAAGIGYLGVEAVASDGFVTRLRERFGPPSPQLGGVVEDLPWPVLEQAFAPTPAATMAPTLAPTIAPTIARAG